MIYFISYSLFLFFSVIGIGKLTNLFFKNSKIQEPLYGILGLIYLTIFSTVFHFFFSLSEFINLSIFFIGFLFFLFNKDFLLLKKTDFYIFFLFGLLLFFNHKPHEDFGYYHLPYVINFNSEKIIFGFGNIADPYVWNSLWLNLLAIFNLPIVKYKLISLPSLLLLIYVVLYFFNYIKENLGKKKFNISVTFAIFFIFYTIIKFSRFSSYGIDIPSLLLISTLFLLLINIYELSKINNIQFYTIICISLFLPLIKLSNFAVIFILLIILIKFKSAISYIKILKISTVPVFLVTIWIVQQFIYTGCLGFPTSVTCVNVNWFNNDILNLGQKLEIINKGYSNFKYKSTILAENYIENFNWISHWFIRTKTELSEHLIAILIVPLLMLIFSCFKLRRNKIKFEYLVLFFVYIIFSLIILEKSPLVRFGLATLFLIIFCIFIYFLEINLQKLNKKLFFSLIFLSLVYSSTKNIVRIDNFNYPYPTYIKSNFETKKTGVSNIFLHKPVNKDQGWQGYLCWNTPFICTYKFDNIIVNRSKLNYLIVSIK